MEGEALGIPFHSYEPLLKASIVRCYLELSIGSPSLFPLSVKDLANNYLGKAVLRPTEKAQFIRRFEEAIRSLGKGKLIITSYQKDKNHPHLLPKKLIHVWNIKEEE